VLEHNGLPELAIFRDLCVPDREDECVGLLEVFKRFLESENKGRGVSAWAWKKEGRKREEKERTNLSRVLSPAVDFLSGGASGGGEGVDDRSRHARNRWM